MLLPRSLDNDATAAYLPALYLLFSSFRLSSSFTPNHPSIGTASHHFISALHLTFTHPTLSHPHSSTPSSSPPPTMHAHNIAVAMAMAGSSLAAVIQNPPSTTIVYTTEVRGYGPTCAGVGPAAASPSDYVHPTQQDLDNLDYDGDGDIDHHDVARLRELSAKPTEAATSTLPKYPELFTSTCPECPHPSEYDPQWAQHAVLNDTLKHHNGFKLFAEPEGLPHFPMRFAVHVREHEGRKDIWNIKLFPSALDDALKEMGTNLSEIIKATPPSERAELEKLNSNFHQPRWNLADNRLETRSRDSAPVDDTLYLRLFEDKDLKDTSQFHGGKVYRTVLTTNPSKNKYNKEHNAKLLAKKSWQLVRDADPSTEYSVKDKDIKGNFFWCTSKEKIEAFTKLTEDTPNKEKNKENKENFLDVLRATGSHDGGELRYIDSNEKLIPLTKGGSTCMAMKLRVRLCFHVLQYLA